jgi:hypothetical protein
MTLPFSEEQFLRVFADYNRAVWPAQLVLYAAAFLTLFIAFKGKPYAGRVAVTTLALLWLWMGVAYHLAFFASINSAAYLFGAFFILQGLLFLAWGVRKPPARIRLRADSHGMAAAALLAYSLVVYPALGYLLGRAYPASPTFGLPCPTTIYTFGLLLCVEGRVPLRLVPIPLAWSVVGASAASALGITEDYVLVASGLAGALLIVRRNRRHDRRPHHVTA